MTDSTASNPSDITDLLVIGAGPTGLACAIEAQRRGFSAVLVDKGCLCNSLFHYPAHMTFFTTPELLEIGDIPFSSPNQKPSRNEALEYYRKVTEHYRLDVRQYETVESVSGSDRNFTIHTTDRFGRAFHHRARKLVIATGYYDLPNHLDIPGEELSKVKHYYDEPHPYYDLDVLVIGGKNSAAIAALELWRHGARVTLVHRGKEMHRHVKYWILPDINNRIKNHEVTAHFSSAVTQISRRHSHARHPRRHASPFPTTLSSHSPAITRTSSSSSASASSSTPPTTAAPSAIPPRSRATSRASISLESSLLASAQTRYSSRTADSTANRSRSR